MDQVEPQPTEEQLLAEARLLPVLLARRLGDLAGVLLRMCLCVPAHRTASVAGCPLLVLD
jgi:hypothetical protein